MFWLGSRYYFPNCWCHDAVLTTAVSWPWRKFSGMSLSTRWDRCSLQFQVPAVPSGPRQVQTTTRDETPEANGSDQEEILFVERVDACPSWTLNGSNFWNEVFLRPYVCNCPVTCYTSGFRSLFGQDKCVKILLFLSKEYTSQNKFQQGKKATNYKTSLRFRLNVPYRLVYKLHFFAPKSGIKRRVASYTWVCSSFEIQRKKW